MEVVLEREPGGGSIQFSAYGYIVYVSIFILEAGAVTCSAASSAPSVGIEVVSYEELARPDGAHGLLDAALLQAFGRDGLGVVGIRGVPSFPAAR